MTLMQKIKCDIIQYRRDRNSKATVLLQTLIGELQTKEKNGKVISDADVISLINTFIANNNTTLSNTSDQARQMVLAAESILLNTYLPKRLSESEISDIISEKSFASIKEGMDYFRSNYAGQYDGGYVSKLLKK